MTVKNPNATDMTAYDVYDSIIVMIALSVAMYEILMKNKKTMHDFIYDDNVDSFPVTIYKIFAIKSLQSMKSCV